MNTGRARASIHVLAAMTALVCTACGEDGRRAASSSPPTLRIGTFAKSRVGWFAGFLASDPLVAVSWDGRAIYRLAESAAESPDGTTIHVKLRQGLEFHSGEAVTAPRVRDLLEKKIAGAHTAEIASIEATGDTDLVIRLNVAHSLKPVDLNDYPVDDDDRPRLRTGPFRISALGPPAVLDRFEGYYQGRPALQRVEIHEYDSHRAAWAAMLRAEINFLHELSREAIGFTVAGGNIRAYPLLRPFTIALAFNLRHPILGRRDVRLALNEAVDRDEVVQNGMRGYGEPAEGPFWPHHWAYPRGLGTQRHNPEAARLRLDTAGFPLRERGAAAMPGRFGFTCLIVGGDVRFERIALVVQRQLFALGVEMKVSVIRSAQELIERVSKGRFDAFLYEMASGRTLRFPYRFWHSRAAVLPTGYSAADDALDRMKVARTDDQVRLAVSDVMRTLRSDPPAVFLAFPREARAADAAFDIPYEPDRDVLGTLWRARFGALAAERAR